MPGAGAQAERRVPAATVDEQLVTLLPGETATFTVETDRAPGPGALAAPPVLRCASDLVRVTT
jgi:beta-mannosidase